MKKFLFFLLIIFCSFTVTNSKTYKSVLDKKCNTAQTQYGLYGEVQWPVSGSPYNAVESPEVKIYKLISGSWVYQGSTYASACGYYTYETNGMGVFKAEITGYYYLRDYPNCSTRVDYGYHAGSGQGTIFLWNSWIVVNVRCS